jgi:hypothetical protein
VVSTLRGRAGDAQVQGGKSGIFTPHFFFHAKKPAARRSP